MKRPKLRVFRSGKASDFDRAMISQLHTQSCVLEQHERQIALHTKIQSSIAGWQLFVGTITTAALIYIAYEQYQASERQVSLEYAKVSPLFDMEVIPFEKGKVSDGGSFPNQIKIRLIRGDAAITSVETYQDISVSTLDKNAKHHRCIVRIPNYFSPKSSSTDFNATDVFAKISRDESGFYPSYPGEFYIFSPRQTWVTIHFKDIFGKDRAELFGGDGEKLEKLPSLELPTDEFEPAHQGKLKRGNMAMGPLIFEKDKSIKVDENCGYILNTLQT